MGVKGHSRGRLGTPRHVALGRSRLIPTADAGCSQDGVILGCVGLQSMRKIQ